MRRVPARPGGIVNSTVDELERLARADRAGEDDAITVVEDDRRAELDAQREQPQRPREVHRRELVAHQHRHMRTVGGRSVRAHAGVTGRFEDTPVGTNGLLGRAVEHELDADRHDGFRTVTSISPHASG